jgi:hypothetical protein
MKSRYLVLIILFSTAFGYTTNAQNAYNYAWHHADTEPNSPPVQGSALSKSNQPQRVKEKNGITYELSRFSYFDSSDVQIGPGENWLYASAVGANFSSVFYVNRYDYYGNYLGSLKLAEIPAGSAIQSQVFEVTDDFIVFGISNFDSINLSPNVGPTYVSGNITFLAFYNHSGDYLWHIEYSAGTQLAGSRVDESQNLYVHGAFTGDVDFDFSSATDLRSSQGYKDAFLTKINIAAQTYEWAITTGASDGDELFEFSAFSLDRIAMLGYTRSVNAVDLDPGNGTFNVNNAEGDYYIVQYDLNGTFVNAASFEADFQYCGGFTADKEGNMYVSLVDQSSSMVDVDLSSNVVNAFTSGGIPDNYYVIKYAPDLSHLWNTTLNDSDDFMEIFWTGASYFSLTEAGSYIALQTTNLGGDLSQSVNGMAPTIIGTSSASFRNQVLFAIDKQTGNVEDMVIYDGTIFLWDYTSSQLGELFLVGTYSSPVDFNPYNTLNETQTPVGVEPYFPFIAKINWTEYLALKEGASISSFEAYPNPVSDILKVVAPETVHMELLNMEGKLLSEQSVIDGQATISLANLPEGVYIVKVIDREGRYGVRRIVKK